MLLILAACIVIPLLLRSGCARQSEGELSILSENPSDEAAAAIATPAPTSVDSAVNQILSPGGSAATKPAAATPAASAPASKTTTKPATAAPSTSAGAIVSYTVKTSDTLSTVASALGVSVRVLRASNRLHENQTLAAGQVVYASRAGVIHTIKAGQTLTDISLTYAVPVQTLASANGLTTASTIYAGSRIIIPGGTSALWDTVDDLSKGTASDYIWPVEADVVSTFGWRVHEVLGTRQHHDGIDLNVPEGTVVRASAGGKVYYYGEQPGYGNLLIIEHADTWYSMYGHLSSSLVYVGQYVEAGQRVAMSGNTGISSGPHLHFELRRGEVPVDPLRYLP